MMGTSTTNVKSPSLSTRHEDTVMSSGAKVTTAIIPEVTPGVTPEGKWWEMKRSSFGLKTTFARNKSDEIGATRMTQSTGAGVTNIAGDVGMKLRVNPVTDALLESCFGARFTGDKLVVGEENITFSVANSARDISVNAIYRGVRVTQLALTVPHDNSITMTVSLAGTGFDSRQGAPFYTDPLDTAVNDVVVTDFKHLRNPKIDGQPLAGNACVDSINLTFNNNNQTQFCLGDGMGTPGNQISTEFEPTGQIRLAWSPKAYDVWASQKDKRTMSFEFDVEAANGTYSFYFPRVEFSGDWPDGGSNDLIQATLSLAAIVESPVITRKFPQKPGK